MPSNEKQRSLIPPEVLKPFVDAYFADVAKGNDQHYQRNDAITRSAIETTIEGDVGEGE